MYKTPKTRDHKNRDNSRSCTYIDMYYNDDYDNKYNLELQDFKLILETFNKL